MNKQSLTPFLTKLIEYAENKEIISFDVPGHKLGRINDDLRNYLGEKLYRLDCNSPIGLDNLNKPKGVLLEASNLMAEAFKGNKAFFLTGGTTMGILSLVMSVVKSKEKIILPRNVHKSTINALILSGAIPVFIYPEFDVKLGISNQVSFEDVKKCIEENTDARAILLLNPTYFGVTCDIMKIVDFAHQYNIVVLVDEAHGSHFGFSNLLPLSSMECYADAMTASLHKTIGSLTESSIIVTQGLRIDNQKLKSTINMLQSTSPSSLLLASLDSSRKYFYEHGEEDIKRVLELALEARKKINKIKGLFSPDKEYFTKNGSFDYDETKLIVYIKEIGLPGPLVYKKLFYDYQIQIELAEPNLILMVLTSGTNEHDLNKLVLALQDISKEFYSDPEIDYEPPVVTYKYPEYSVRPRVAYHAPYKYILLNEAENEIIAESIMIYPPGIPLVIPGEIINQEIINELIYYQNTDSLILKDTDGILVKVIDKEKWNKYLEDEENEEK
ncbi:MAG: aminotransferase class I/II-fold pyridoxal phosphate-dependent enzyme [Acholeplasmatales bacterium]|jgi:lysine decarboxylase|nr:aminotransferase class I/II-fold pyridoxal phosphate-dependent enzyme [Acholeplasmatales bacterium]